MITAALTMLLASLAAAPTIADTMRPRVQLVLFTARDVALDAREASEIASLVRDIWKPYADLTVVTRHDTWRPMVQDEIHVFITNRSLAGTDNAGLGWIDFVDGEPQRRIFVSMPGVRTLLDGAAWRGQRLQAWPPLVTRLFVRRAVARAIAHEVGHYLLRTRHHAATGLMRPVVNSTQVLDTVPADTRLAPDDVMRLIEMSPLSAAVAGGADGGGLQ